MAPFFSWLWKLLSSPAAREVEAELLGKAQQLIAPDPPGQPLSSAAVSHQRAQAASAAHAFPPVCPASAPPSAPPPTLPPEPGELPPSRPRR